MDEKVADGAHGETWEGDEPTANEDPAGGMVGGVLDRTTYALDHLPEGSGLRSVTAAPADIAGRQALRVELTDTVTFDGKPGVDYVDMPTFVIIPARFTNGTIEVDILSRLNGKGPADARAFAGIAYESLGWRPLRSGLSASPQRTEDQPAKPTRSARDPVLRLSRLAVRSAAKRVPGRPLRSGSRYRLR